jgi:prepilin-type N-terminal cleavage/methylation domain-containing protein
MTHSRRRARLRSRRGLTLVEMIIAIIVMAIGIMGLAGTASYVAMQMGGGNAQTIAAAMAAKVADSVAARPCSALINGSRTSRGVKVTWTVGAGNSARTRRVTETVEYKPKRGPTKSVTYTLALQCPEMGP